MLDAVAPVGARQFRDAAPVPGRQWLRFLGDTPPDHAPRGASGPWNRESKAEEGTRAFHRLAIAWTASREPALSPVECDQLQARLILIRRWDLDRLTVVNA
jgi:hypothetical protein